MSSLPATISYLIRWLERIARTGSRRDSVRGSVGAMSVPQSRPDSFVSWLGSWPAVVASMYAALREQLNSFLSVRAGGRITNLRDLCEGKDEIDSYLWLMDITVCRRWGGRLLWTIGESLLLRWGGRLLWTIGESLLLRWGGRLLWTMVESLLLRWGGRLLWTMVESLLLRWGGRLLWTMVESLLLRRVCHISRFITLLSANQGSLKRAYLEFRYYADAIHSDLTPPG